MDKQDDKSPPPARPARNQHGPREPQRQEDEQEDKMDPLEQVPDQVPVTAGSGNVFTDLGFPETEAAELVAKAELARRIASIIGQRHLSQTAAAELLGIDQPKVSALLHGRLSGFSLERLIRFLLALDRDVQIVVRPKSRRNVTGQLRVVVR